MTQPQWAPLPSDPEIQAKFGPPRIGVIMGSQSDWPIMREAVVELVRLGISCERRIVSAHRTPRRMVEYAQTAAERGIKVIIAGAGGAAHLPGMVASLTRRPVIGVPILTRNLMGIDSLLSIVQMPAGIPVATVAINGSKNAALLAASTLAISDTRVERAYDAFRFNLTQSVAEVPVDEPPAHNELPLDDEMVRALLRKAFTDPVIISTLRLAVLQT